MTATRPANDSLAPRGTQEIGTASAAHGRFELLKAQFEHFKTRLELTSLELTSLELTSFKLTSFKLPCFELTSFELG